MHKFLISIVILVFASLMGNCQFYPDEALKVGAERTELYLDSLKGKSVAMLVNQTSMVGTTHLIDFLIDKGVDVKRIFAAEHGVRGVADAGENVSDEVDSKTGIEIISLYGKSKKPSKLHLSDVDIVIFDIQDVGCRFYTYISSMGYLMEVAAETSTKVIILDRPNPNGDYVAGPVLDTTYRSFVGMFPIPIVHGCTVGELARMINGEHWLNCDVVSDLMVVPMANYTHDMKYSLPIKPSPNLPNDLSIRLYPSLCLFEATNVSVGRGTLYPFQIIGYPREDVGEYSFTPLSIEGMSKDPLHKGKVCYGDDLRLIEEVPMFTLSYFIDYYNRVGDSSAFWNNRRWINLLMGNADFYEQINAGLSEDSIIATWQDSLDRYKIMREKYLLYK